jgi:predicted flap endonuclease-1-like 5' DNA nuclease
MRSDYALYAVALILFAITVISSVVLTTDPERSLSAVATAVLGLLFVGLGYTQRPKPKVETIQAPPPPPSIPKTAEVAAQPKVETNVEPTPEPAKIELIAVKGIKEKRAEQLKALGISNVQELANASAEDLANKLNISSWFTEKWIKNAKELLAKS